MSEEKIMKELAEIKSIVLANKKILSAEEAATYLGMSLSKLYKLTASGDIPYSKPTGRLLFFDRDEISAWAMSKKNINPKEAADRYIQTRA